MSMSKRAARRRIYSAVQVALSLTLLVGTGLLLRAMLRVERADPGFARDHRLIADVYANAGELAAALERARAIPGVADATIASDATGPGNGGCAAMTAGETPRRTQLNIVDANYTAAIRLLDIVGFELGEPEPMGIHGKPFRRFEMER